MVQCVKNKQIVCVTNGSCVDVFPANIYFLPANIQFEHKIVLAMISKWLFLGYCCLETVIVTKYHILCNNMNCNIQLYDEKLLILQFISGQCSESPNKNGICNNYFNLDDTAVW